MDVLEETLLKIAGLFNGLNIRWIVGGSVLLAHFGLHENPHDIDIIVVKEDIEKAKAALDSIGMQKRVPPPPNETFVSDHYYKYDIGGVEVDLIAGFKIKHAKGVYEYKPDFSGEKHAMGIAYAQLEDWYVLYLLMPKGAGKAAKSEEYFYKSGNIEKDKLTNILEMRLPEHTARKISELINKA
jgi:hypothetical protein